jgi:hypothetical protein
MNEEHATICCQGIGNYRILMQLDSVCMGAVYRAQDAKSRPHGRLQAATRPLVDAISLMQ